MRSVMKEAPDPVKKGQECIRFLGKQGRIWGFRAGDCDHVVRSLLQRVMLPTLTQGYQMSAWSPDAKSMTQRQQITKLRDS